MNKKGFTFIEMLGVITILVIISLIILVVVDKSLKDSSGTIYNVQLENIKSAAKMWMTDNIELIPDKGYYTITLGHLLDGGYISPDIKEMIDSNVYNDGMLIRIALNDVVFVPNDSYEYLSFIGTNGNQYINLGYKAKTNTMVELDFQLYENENSYEPAVTNFNNIIGIDTLESNKFNVNFGADDNQFNQLFYWVDVPYVAGGPTYSYIYNDVLKRSIMTVKSGSATYQGVSHDIEVKSSDNEGNMVLFGSYSAAINGIVPFGRYNSKIYNFRIYEGEELVRDLVPLYRKSDGVAGLYDFINDVFYESDGSSDFLFIR